MEGEQLNITERPMSTHRVLKGRLELQARRGDDEPGAGVEQVTAIPWT